MPGATPAGLGDHPVPRRRPAGLDCSRAGRDTAAFRAGTAGRAPGTRADRGHRQRGPGAPRGTHDRGPDSADGPGEDRRPGRLRLRRGGPAAPADRAAGRSARPSDHRSAGGGARGGPGGRGRARWPGGDRRRGLRGTGPARPGPGGRRTRHRCVGGHERLGGPGPGRGTPPLAPLARLLRFRAGHHHRRAAAGGRRPACPRRPRQRPAPYRAARGRHDHRPRPAHPHRRGGQPRPVRAARRPRSRPGQHHWPGRLLRWPAGHGPAQQRRVRRARPADRRRHGRAVPGGGDRAGAGAARAGRLLVPGPPRRPRPGRGDRLQREPGRDLHGGPGGDLHHSLGRRAVGDGRRHGPAGHRVVHAAAPAARPGGGHSPDGADAIGTADGPRLAGIRPRRPRRARRGGPAGQRVPAAAHPRRRGPGDPDQPGRPARAAHRTAAPRLDVPPRSS